MMKEKREVSTYPLRWTAFVQDLTEREKAAIQETTSEAKAVRSASFAEIVGESPQL